ncbi:Copine [Carpediemonas membranifera]|uniref:Copine n=1 Tax=Carpediemonas membranifera TaxID=201153 RepID=A0A8J6APZ7_9EUKA|nr:Copine [Carpediemonas membranifera]|eukprot:KAG9390313.1 Copine [Carpediemonas membranifera]
MDYSQAGQPQGIYSDPNAPQIQPQGMYGDPNAPQEPPHGTYGDVNAPQLFQQPTYSEMPMLQRMDTIPSQLQDRVGSTAVMELSVGLRNLPNLDVLSKTDPIVCIYQLKSGQLVEVGRTEIIKDCLNPDFTDKIRINYYFETNQQLVIRAFDIDDWNSADMRRQEFIGETSMQLASILMAPRQSITQTLKRNGKARGDVVVSAEQLTQSSQAAQFQFRVSKVAAKDLFTSDPFLAIHRSTEAGTGFTPVWKSEVHKRAKKCSFRERTVDLLTLCNGDTARPLKLVLSDWNSSGDHDLIGEVTASVDQLVDLARGGQTLTFTDPTAKTAKKMRKPRGLLHVLRFDVVDTPSFVGMLERGLQLHLTVAIDFTASNGNPADARSLHYMGDPNRPNEYQQAIRSVGEVLAPYDLRGMFTTLGFGAALPPRGQTSHCFFLAPGDGSVVGPYGVEAAYQTTLSQVRLSGPTLFAGLVADRARQAQSRGPGHYDVLLLLTDGVLMDARATIDAIVAAARTPLSIIIVGVGGEDWTTMNVLDADDEPLVSSTGERMARDIVQFVPYREAAAQSCIAQETLAELPDQVVAWSRVAAGMGVPFVE